MNDSFLQSPEALLRSRLGFGQLRDRSLQVSQGDGHLLNDAVKSAQLFSKGDLRLPFRYSLEDFHQGISHRFLKRSLELSANLSSFFRRQSVRHVPLLNEGTILPRRGGEKQSPAWIVARDWACMLDGLMRGILTDGEGSVIVINL